MITIDKTTYQTTTKPVVIREENYDTIRLGMYLYIPSDHKVRIQGGLAVLTNSSSHYNHKYNNSILAFEEIGVKYRFNELNKQQKYLSRIFGNKLAFRY